MDRDRIAALNENGVRFARFIELELKEFHA